MVTNSTSGNQGDLGVSNADWDRKVVLSADVLKRATLTLRSIRHPERKRILQSIVDKEEITVTEICEKVKLRQAAVSLHLTVLRRAEIVNTRRDGKFIYYSINVNRAMEVMDAARHLDW